VAPTDDLHERDLGLWAGLSFGEIERGWPGQLEAWHTNELAGPPGGETDKEVADRLTGALLRSVPRHSTQIHLVVGHAGVLRGFVSHNNIPDAKVPPLGGRFLSLDRSDNALSVGPCIEL
jgi:broad specificity phosphatase PhoE